MILNGAEGKPMPIYGDGRNVRDWLYVRDHCRAIWAIMKEGRRGETYTIGGNTEMENIRLVELICDMLDTYQGGKPSKRDLITFVKDRPGHDFRYAIDSTRLEQELGWAPEESLESGLQKTIRWYRDNREWVERVRSGEYRSWIKAHYAHGV
jgi:dTDP-glucose 4,6-dehydratase